MSSSSSSSSSKSTKSDRECVNILMIGDSGAGKSSIMSHLLNNEKKTNVDALMKPVTIPAQGNPDNVEAKIHDSNDETVKELINDMDVFCVVYDVNDAQTFDNVSKKWLPLLNNLKKPVILVGNKIDARKEEQSNKELEAVIKPIMEKFSEVETCVECSAYGGDNIHQIFFFALKAVVYPTAPLFDAQEHILKKKAVSALTRIFQLCDKDHDQILNDTELSGFQQQCFQMPLEAKELAAVKQTVNEGDVNGLRDGGVTLAGFLYLNTLFIQRGRMETTWSIMRRFGYDDNLDIKEGYKWPSNVENCPVGERVTLTDEGIEFLEEVFDSWVATKKKSSSRMMGVKKLKQLFGIVPEALTLQLLPEWSLKPYELTSKKMGINGWFSFWRYQIGVNPKEALEALAYMGCELKNCVTTTLGLDKTINNKFSRNLLVGYVMGSQGSGKSSFLSHVLGVHDDTGGKVVVTASEMHRYNDTTVALEEVTDYESILNDEEKRAKADMYLVVVDVTSSQSIDYATVVLDTLIDKELSVPATIVFNRGSDNKDAQGKAETKLDQLFDESVGMMDLNLSEDASHWRTSIVSVCAEHISVPKRSRESAADKLKASATKKTKVDDKKNNKGKESSVKDNGKGKAKESSGKESGKDKEASKTKQNNAKDGTEKSVAKKETEEGSSILFPLLTVGLIGGGAYYWWQQQQGGGDDSEVELL